MGIRYMVPGARPASEDLLTIGLDSDFLTFAQVAGMNNSNSNTATLDIILKFVPGIIFLIFLFSITILFFSPT